MDALRLIKTTRHALAEARSVPDVLAEAWQAALITEAVGARIAGQEDGELAPLGQMLCDAGAHAVGCLELPGPAGGAPEGAPAGGDQEWHRADWGGNGRASRLDELGEAGPVLTELALLLHEVAEALVVLACGADEEGLYWRCIDGVDAGAECKETVAELLRMIRRQSPEAAAAPVAEGAVGAVGAVAPGEAAAPPEPGPGPGSAPGAGAGPGPGVGVGGPAEAGGAGPTGSQGVPTLVVPLGPPVAACEGQPRAAASVERSSGRRRAPARSAEDCRSASSPARSAFRSASSCCICSSRFIGAAAGAGVVCCGAVGASDQGSDMSGPLQLGSAV
ncbi:DUF6099 family protein [Kitasatospora sp. NPDC051853]|uniref:DUF6099 family protein n=1 Tax=Kitasatospora sp. NPDC051853 TaxID=3364058 RepID=UPI003789FCD2